jgi:glycosyltransferase involved in cell wall biosynthesis
MHVLIIPSWYPDTPGDANGSFFREQAIALARSGCKVGLIYPNFRSLRKLALAVTEPRGIVFENDEGVLTYRLQAFNWTPRLPAGIHWQWMRSGLALFERYVAAQGMPDVIHAHSMLFAGKLGAAVKHAHGVPLAITEHSTGYAKENLSPYELSQARRAADAANKKFAVSQDLADLLNRRFLGDGPDWQVLPNIVNRAFLQHPLPAFKSPGRQFRFINVALLNKIKQHANLIRAFALAFASDPDVTLTIAGDGPERETLRKLIDELALGERVRLLGLVERDQVPTLLAGADAFVLSSSYETFGVVVAEALAMGLPVVCTQCGGPNSIVTETDGFLVAPDDIEALADGMRDMRTRSKAFDPHRIRAHCAARYGERAIVDELTMAYHDLAVSSHAPR